MEVEPRSVDTIADPLNLGLPATVIARVESLLDQALHPLRNARRVASPRVGTERRCQACGQFHLKGVPWQVQSAWIPSALSQVQNFVAPAGLQLVPWTLVQRAY